MPVTPFRVAVITGLVVFASVGAPHIASFKNSGWSGSKAPTGLRQSPDREADVIKYRDNKGQLNFASDIESVPEKYRANAVVRPKLPPVAYGEFVKSEPSTKIGKVISSLKAVTKFNQAPSSVEANLAPAQLTKRGGDGVIKPPGSGKFTSQSPNADQDEASNESALKTAEEWLQFSRKSFFDASVALGGPGDPGPDAR